MRYNGVVYTVGEEETKESDQPTEGKKVVVETPFMEKETIPGLPNKFLVYGTIGFFAFAALSKR
jgi:hypothetical protein